MPGTRPNFVNQLLEMWKRLTVQQRITIALFAVLGMALVGSVVYFMNRVEYQALYRDLNPEDAQAIAAKLKEEKRDFTVEGTSILVAAPKEEIDKLRLEIAGSGLARSGKVGYEIFDKNQFGMTDFTEQVNLQRALEGELARTIASLSEISQARVHIVLPKDSIYEDKKEEAKASVVLSLKRGAELSKPSIAGIKGIVANAVPGLRSQSVSIVDEEGRLLSQSMESGDVARLEMETGLREQFEKEMSRKVVSILEPLVGQGKVHANASIELDFNTTEQTEETFNPSPAAIVSQQKSEERSAGAITPAGIPGTQSNVGQAQPSRSAGPESMRQSETTNYEVNRLVRHTVQPKGSAVRRLSVAVIMDNKTIYSTSKDGKVTSRTEPRTQKEIDASRQLVCAAVGYNAERGDVVSIENVPFYSETRPEAPQPAAPWYQRWQSHQYASPAIKYVALLILFFMAYLVLFRPVRNRVLHAIAAAAPAPALEAAAPLGALPAAEGEARALPEGQPAEIAGTTVDGAAPALPAAPESAGAADLISLETATDEQIERELMKEANAVDMGGRKYAAMKKKVIEKAKKDPEMISQLVRMLLREKA